MAQADCEHNACEEPGSSQMAARINYNPQTL